MGHIISVSEQSHNFASVVNRTRSGENSAGNINRGELATAQEKAMAHAIRARTLREITRTYIISSDDFSSPVNAEGKRDDSPGEIDGGELTSAE
jgi:hypothetical protein